MKIVKQVADKYGFNWPVLEAGEFPQAEVAVLIPLFKKTFSGKAKDIRAYFEQKAKFISKRLNDTARHASK